MKEKEFAKFISTPSGTDQGSRKAHKSTGSKLGPVYTLLGEEVIPGSDIRVIVRHVLKDREEVEYPNYVEEHVHDVSKAYIILSEDPGSLEADIVLGKDRYEIKSPTAIYVPAGIEHNVQITKGHGFLIMVMPGKGTYDEHTFPVSKK